MKKITSFHQLLKLRNDADVVRALLDKHVPDNIKAMIIDEYRLQKEQCVQTSAFSIEPKAKSIYSTRVCDPNDPYYRNWLKFQQWADKQNFQNLLKLQPITQEQFSKLASKHEAKVIAEKLQYMENSKIIEKYVSLYRTLDNWLKPKEETTTELLHWSQKR